MADKEALRGGLYLLGYGVYLDLTKVEPSILFILGVHGCSFF